MKKYSLEDVANMINREGIGYSITDMLGYSSIDDEHLAILWQKAESALIDIEDYLTDVLGEWKE